MSFKKSINSTSNQMSSSKTINQDSSQNEFHQLIRILINLKITAIEISQCPLIPNQDPNPYHPYNIYEEDKLAIHQKTLYKVYQNACIEFGQKYPEFKTRFEDLNHESYDDLKYNQLNPEGDLTLDTLLSDLDHITKVLLIQNPDHTTAGSCRRQLIQKLTDRAHPKDRLKVQRQLLRKDFNFTTLILSIASHAKSSTIWEYRRWCLIETYSLKESEQTSSTSTQVISKLPQPRRTVPASCASDEEFDFTSKCADIYPRNYFAWRHRMWLLDGLSSLSYEESKPLLGKEIERLMVFWRSHPRDHSCTHYITYLIKSWNTSFGQSIHPKSLFTDSFLTTIEEIILSYPDSETSWLLFRYLFSDTDISHSILTKPLSDKILKMLNMIDLNSSETLKSRFFKNVSLEPNSTITLFTKEIKAENRTASLGFLTFYWLALQEIPNDESYELSDWILKHLKSYPPDSHEWPSTVLIRLSSYLKQINHVNLIGNGV
ncbi:hypothetical protein DFH28DRAFT_957492 [Melampsora americana]|nr:hypothetical protein DFH28DRAFT_957492 [Melampsora americana]